MNMIPVVRTIAKLTGRDTSRGLDPMLEEHDDAIHQNAVSPILPAATSKERHLFSHGPMSVGVSLRSMLTMMPVMIKLMRSYKTVIRMAGHQRQSRDRRIDDRLRERLERKAIRWGALDIRYVQVPDETIFRGKSIPYKHAIVITGEMDKEKIATAPSFTCMTEVQAAYAETGTVVTKIARYLRRRGYAAVFTDIENLPLSQFNEYEWIPDFCSTCGKCIRSCPANALYEEKQLDEWGQLTTTDGDKCILYFAKNYGCSICIKVCPFTTKGYEAVLESHQRKANNADG